MSRVSAQSLAVVRVFRVVLIGTGHARQVYSDQLFCGGDGYREQLIGLVIVEASRD